VLDTKSPKYLEMAPRAHFPFRRLEMNPSCCAKSCSADDATTASSSSSCSSGSGADLLSPGPRPPRRWPLPVLPRCVRPQAPPGRHLLQHPCPPVEVLGPGLGLLPPRPDGGCVGASPNRLPPRLRDVPARERVLVGG
jgi:hypothetical protein